MGVGVMDGSKVGRSVLVGVEVLEGVGAVVLFRAARGVILSVSAVASVAGTCVAVAKTCVEVVTGARLALEDDDKKKMTKIRAARIANKMKEKNAQ